MPPPAHRAVSTRGRHRTCRPERAFDLDNNTICIFLAKTVSMAPSTGRCNVATCSSSCFGKRQTSYLQSALSFQYFNKSSCVSTCFVKEHDTKRNDGRKLARSRCDQRGRALQAGHVDLETPSTNQDSPAPGSEHEGMMARGATRIEKSGHLYNLLESEW